MPRKRKSSNNLNPLPKHNTDVVTSQKVIADQQTNPDNKKSDSIIPLEPKKTSTSRTDNKPTQSTQELDNHSEPYCQKFLRRWLIVFFTGALACYTALLYTLTGKQAKEASANSDTANVFTRRSIDLAERNFIIENRAWVCLRNPAKAQANVERENEVGFDFTWEIQNFGKTPAESVCIGYNYSIGKTPDPNNRTLILDTPRTLSPGEVHNCTFFQPIKNDSLNARIREQRTRLYFFGMITYKDVYGRIDTTEFTFLFNSPEFFSYRGVDMLPVGINRIK
jgi:hypothetical protein